MAVFLQRSRRERKNARQQWLASAAWRRQLAEEARDVGDDSAARWHEKGMRRALKIAQKLRRPSVTEG